MEYIDKYDQLLKLLTEEIEIDGGEDGEVRILLKKAKLDDLLEEYA